MAAPPLLRLEGLTKHFGEAPVLKEVSLELRPGEAIGLIGENGAGKSTFIKLLSGVHQPDGGRMEWMGRPLRLPSPSAALAHGIATIHQELADFGKLTVAENLLFGEAWPRHAWGGVHWPKLFARAAERLRAFGLDLDPRLPFGGLGAAARQEVAIIRALARQARLLILDEPTASLSGPETDRLLGHLARLRASGVALIYVSHRLEEVLGLADRMVVLRDGALVADLPAKQTSLPELVRLMVGRALVERARETTAAGEAILELRGAGKAGMFEDLSLTVRAGEIMGLGGLVGAGRSELARAIFGLYPLDSGAMTLDGDPWRPGSPAEALRAGIVYVPEERKRQGFVLEHSLIDSIAIGFSDLLMRFGLVSGRRVAERTVQAAARWQIRHHGLSEPIGALSGGNQQKALLARWLERNPRLVILDEPTRGVDIGAKSEIHQLIRRLAADGRGVLLISSDLPELLALSHRVAVLHAGRLTAELHGSALTQENVLLAASGLAPFEMGPR